MVTHGDLQHHRWKLVKVNGEPVADNDWPMVPVLDFGERLFVEGNDGCRTFSGFAALTGQTIAFQGLEITKTRCDDSRYVKDSFSIDGEWKLSISESAYLRLENERWSLVYKLDDWR